MIDDDPHTEMYVKLIRADAIGAAIGCVLMLVGLVWVLSQ